MAAEQGDPGWTVLLVLDATSLGGAGHAIRCLALAEEFAHRGVRSAHVGRIDIPWVDAAYRSLGITMLGPIPPVRAAEDPRITALVVDSYTLTTEMSTAMAQLGKPVLAVVDDSRRNSIGTLYLDQNAGASPEALGLSAAEALCGPRFALLRDSVLRCRTQPWHPRGRAERRKVCVLFGGTDPVHGAQVVARILAQTGVPMDVSVLAASADHAREVTAVPWSVDQRPTLLAPNPRLVDQWADADLVITAGGTTVYELMALGRPFAVCTVADNQTRHVDRLVDLGAAFGLGSIDSLRQDPQGGVDLLGAFLLDDPRNAAMAAQGFATVDGRGRKRVVDRLLGEGEAPGPIGRVPRGGQWP